MTAARDPIDRERTAERLKGSARRGVQRLRERFDDAQLGRGRSRSGRARVTAVEARRAGDDHADVAPTGTATVEDTGEEPADDILAA